MLLYTSLSLRRFRPTYDLVDQKQTDASPTTSELSNWINQALEDMNQEHWTSARERLAKVIAATDMPERGRLKAVAHSLLGEVEDALDNNKEALQHFQTALNFFNSQGDFWNVVAIQSSIGMLCRKMHQIDNAILAYNEAKRLLTATKWPAEFLPQVPLRLAMIENNLGVAYWDRGDSEKADNALKQAETFHDDALLAAQVQINRGNILSDRGEPEEALAHYNLAINALQAKKMEQRDLRIAISNSAMMHYRLGRLSEAERICRDALDRYQKAGDRSGKARTLYNLGLILLAAGKATAALSSHEEAQLCAQAIADHLVDAQARTEIGRILLRDRRVPKDARTMLDKALATLRAYAPDHLGDTDTLILLSQCAVELGDQETSIKLLQEFQAKAEARHDSYAACVGIANLGYVYDQLNKVTTAATKYREALARVSSLNDWFLEASLAYNLGSILERQAVLDHSQSVTL